MNPADVTNEWLVNKKNRGWHRRFHLRKTADQPPTMQSADKHGPKKIAEEWEKSTVWPSSKKPPQAAQQSRQRANDNEDPLRFTCSLCRDSREYAPKDLLRHFEEKHPGSPPVFSCHTCTFSTHELSYLQVHLLSHKDTFSSCAMCEDNIQRTWAEFRAHLTAHHFQDGKYSCQICQKFSTGDVGLFLQHAYVHHLTLEGTRGGVQAKDTRKFVLKATARTLRCQHCGCEVSRKLLINDDIQAVHICSGDNLMKAWKEGVRPAVVKPNHSSPKMKLRLTRSAVREMCWLTQDCLALPGREFLDKYCHLSDPQTTLEDTQQFLMKSVAGETADPKWTKALKSVLSSVPQEINLHPVSDNGKVSKSSDLTVLTVKNKITVAQNGGGAAYCKKLRTTTSVEKETGPAGNVTGEDPGQNGCRSGLNDSPRGGDDASGHGVTPGRIRTLENQKNQEDGIRIELKLADESEAPPPRRKLAKRTRKRQNVRRKRKVLRSKKADKKAAGLPLKIVLKKNPVKEKQWVSQSREGASDGCPGQAGLHPTPGETAHLAHDAVVTESRQSKGTKASDGHSLDRSGATAGTQRMEPEASSTAELGLGPGDPLQVRQGGADASAPPAEALHRVDFHASHPARRSPAAEGGTAPSSSTKSAPSEPVITLQAKRSSGGLSLPVPSEETGERTRDREVLADSGPGPGGNSDAPIADARCPPRPTPKGLERTLKLVAISPYQPVRRPAGNQPVVVLNHPDADIPEVARIMEVINRYKGAVRKVALSRTTLSALAAASAEVTKAKDPTGVEREGRNSCVQERFRLKLKLRRLSRKKYEVVGGACPGRGAAVSFCCWFCGRVFVSQEMWVIHRQRHLMEWK